MNTSPVVAGESGYTLVEIMIVVAILGILAGIAVPSYQRYVAQGEVGSGLATISPMRSIVESNLGSGVGGADITVANLGIVPNANSLGVTSMAFASDGSGQIAFAYGATSSPRVMGGSLVLARTTDGTWVCQTSGGVSDFKPQGCN